MTLFKCGLKNMVTNIRLSLNQRLTTEYRVYDVQGSCSLALRMPHFQPDSQSSAPGIETGQFGQHL